MNPKFLTPLGAAYKTQGAINLSDIVNIKNSNYRVDQVIKKPIIYYNNTHKES